MQKYLQMAKWKWSQMTVWVQLMQPQVVKT
jgi:hypothetical protein